MHDRKEEMKKFIILIPIYNDWKSVLKLLSNIDSEVADWDAEVSVLIFNDASTEERPVIELSFKKIKSVKVANMKHNQGHARCNATGLKYLTEKEDFDYVIPMDGDGEDRPEEISDFLIKIQDSEKKPIVGERIKRSENLLFKICYQIHKLITLTFTGKSIKFGNFSCLPKITVEKMVNEKATWNSFSGSLSKVEIDLLKIPSIRGYRYFEPSKMSFYNLLKHSFSIISVFRKAFLIRSAVFIILYILFIKDNASIITSLPLIFLFIAVYSISNLALRENMDEYKNSLNQIDNVEILK